MDFKYFKLEEFDCPCCGKNNTEEELILRLDKARHIAGIPFIVNSGCRCEKHNEEVGGKKKSNHLKGLAADIACKNDVERFRIVKGLIDAGFRRIGVGKGYVHADIAETKYPLIF